MHQQQKKTIIPLLKTAEATRSYQTKYWFTYQDYLDPDDDFTDFVCERLEGKQPYLDLIQQVLAADQTAKFLCRFTAMRNMNMRLIQIHLFFLLRRSLFSADYPFLKLSTFFMRRKISFQAISGKKVLTLHSRLLLSENMAIYCQRKLLLRRGILLITAGGINCVIPK